MITRVVFFTFFLALLIFPLNAYAQDVQEAEIMFQIASEHFAKGEYTQAIEIYDDILEIFPRHIQTLKWKGIALSNLDHHEKSLIEFYKAYQDKPNDVIALTGLGLGFGNFAEYQEAIKYFNLAYEIDPNNVVIKNYKEFAEKVIKKYPYKPTDKPQAFENLKSKAQIPLWIKNNAEWWSRDQISDSDFISGIEHLIKEEIIILEKLPTNIKSTNEGIPGWVKNNAGWWADDLITDDDFLKGIEFLVKDGILIVDATLPEETEKDKETDLYYFKQYLNKIERQVINEKRYIEYPNPSGDVIKKFLRDYIKWNFEQQIQLGVENFPEPTSELVDDTYIVEYKIFVNDQPSGLPLDHVSTLSNSIAYWENQSFTSNSGGEPVKVKFTFVNTRDGANAWVTWVVRNLGEGVLGHANLGKGVVEVALGDYGCDGSFQLYDVLTVEQIMTHELGHTLGQIHSENPNSIMGPILNQKYAYCLLNEYLK